MPLYEYECTACGHLTETLQRMSDPPLTECPQCGAPVRKLLSAPAFQFKGSGWYVTDYARKGPKEGAAGDKGGDDKQAAKGDPSTAKSKESSPAASSSSSSD